MPGPWLEPSGGELAYDVRRVLMEIPTGLSDMQAAAPDLALQWRMTTWSIFQSYFPAAIAPSTSTCHRLWTHRRRPDYP